MYAGTSTGAILAAALADGMSPAEVLKLYEDVGPNIFAPRGWLDSAAGPVDELFRANYSLAALRDALYQQFGDRKLGDLPKYVLLTTIELSAEVSPRVKVFHNFRSRGSDGHVRIIDAVLGSAAAPVYFPAHSFGTSNLIDGGLSLNNPSVAAIAKVAKEEYLLEDVWLLSLGCGRNKCFIQGGDWGYKQWALSSGIPLLSAMFESQVDTADYMCKQLLQSSQYCRVHPDLPVEIGMDDVAAIPTMKTVAQQVNLEKDVDWFVESWIRGNGTI
jgi:patatin-like phospholipase/acyl hydrolase